MANCYICAAPNAIFPLTIKDTFTAHTRCKCTTSQNLCSRCFDCIEGQYKQAWYYHPTKKKWSKLWGRNWSWLISQDESFPIFSESPFNDGIFKVEQLPTREQIRQWLINPPDPPFTICVAESGQKHTYPFSVEATNRNLFPVLFEETLIYVHAVEFIYILDKIEYLMALGFSKAEIKLGEYICNKLIKVEMVEFMDIEKQLAPYRGTSCFSLALFVAIVL